MEGLGMSGGFYNGKRVFVTGHTGFKGAWLCLALARLGADVTGYALRPAAGGAYGAITPRGAVRSVIADIRDVDRLARAFQAAQPEIVFHLAAQPLVLEAHRRPMATFDTNVQGTANLLECARHSGGVRSIVVVTTDKVYHNREWVYGYRENDALGDAEPYAASKACAELVAASYYETFLKKRGAALSTARAGNVIGGGDIARDRIMPDCVRSAMAGQPIILRNPNAVRPYQHVLEPLSAYLLIARRQYEDPALAGSYNIGPAEEGCVTTAALADLFCAAWGGGQRWEAMPRRGAPRESAVLKLDCAKIRQTLGWKPVWDVREAVEKTVEWAKSDDKPGVTNLQMAQFAKEAARWTP